MLLLVYEFEFELAIIHASRAKLTRCWRLCQRLERVLGGGLPLRVVPLWLELDLGEVQIAAHTRMHCLQIF